MVQLFATYVIFQVRPSEPAPAPSPCGCLAHRLSPPQALYHHNSMLAFRLNGFDFNAFPVQVFAPHEQVAPSTTSSPHS